MPYTPEYALDIVGAIFRPTGQTITDADGNEVPEMRKLDGWHVNLRLVGPKFREEAERLFAVYGVLPYQPARIFA